MLTVLLVFGAPVAILAAVALEVASGKQAASPSAGAVSWVPLTWSPPLRTLYWFGLGLLAVGHRIGLTRTGLSPRRWVTVASGWCSPCSCWPWHGTAATGAPAVS